MNLHVPQSHMARAELATFMCVAENIVSSSGVRIGLVQSAVVGAYALTARDRLLDREQVCNLVMHVRYDPADADDYRAEVLCGTAPQPPRVAACLHTRYGGSLPPPAVWSKRGVGVGGAARPLWTGKQVASLLLPPQLELHKTVRGGGGGAAAAATAAGLGGLPPALAQLLDAADEAVVIHQGALLSGRLCKDTVGPVRGGIIEGIATATKSCWAAAKWVSDANRVAHAAMRLPDEGRTVSLMHLLDGAAASGAAVRAHVARALTKAAELEALPLPREVREAGALALTRGVLNVAGGLAVRGLPRRCALADIADSGAKGSATHLAQMMSVIAQQHVQYDGGGSGRMPLSVLPDGRTRALPSTAWGDSRPHARGFVTGSYLSGLDPTSQWAHARAGRDGGVATACGTANAGHEARKRTTPSTNQTALYDGSVRDGDNAVVQQHYGGDDLDAARVVLVGVGAALADVAAAAAAGDAAGDADAACAAVARARWGAAPGAAAQQGAAATAAGLLHLRQVQLMACATVGAKAPAKPAEWARAAFPSAASWARTLSQAAAREPQPRTAPDASADDFAGCLRRLLVEVVALHSAAMAVAVVRPPPPTEPLCNLVTGAWLPDVRSPSLHRAARLRPADDASRTARALLAVECVPTPGCSAATLARARADFLDTYRKALVVPGAAVGVEGTTTYAEPSTQMSFTRDTLVTVSRGADGDGGGALKLDQLPLGELVDDVIASAALPRARALGSVALPLPHPLHIMSVDASGAVRLARVTAVSRHPPCGDIVRVTTASGMQLHATLAKSFLVMDAATGAVVPRAGADLRVGDALPSLPVRGALPRGAVPAAASVGAAKSQSPAAAVARLGGAVTPWSAGAAHKGWAALEALRAAAPSSPSARMGPPSPTRSEDEADTVVLHGDADDGDDGGDADALRVAVRAAHAALPLSSPAEARPELDALDGRFAAGTAAADAAAAGGPRIDAAHVRIAGSPAWARGVLGGLLRNDAWDATHVVGGDDVPTLSLQLHDAVDFAAVVDAAGLPPWTLGCARDRTLLQGVGAVSLALAALRAALMRPPRRTALATLADTPAPRHLLLRQRGTVRAEALLKEASAGVAAAAAAVAAEARKGADLREERARRALLRARKAPPQRAAAALVGPPLAGGDPVVSVERLPGDMAFLYDLTVDDTLNFLVDPPQDAALDGARSVFVRDTLNSVVYDTPLHTLESERVHRRVMGAWVDSLLDAALDRGDPTLQRHPNDTLYLPLPPALRARVPSVDAHGHQTWRVIEAVTRHPPINADGSHTLLHVRTRSGREVTATKAKSFLVRRDNKVVAVAGEDLRVGECLPVVFNDTRDGVPLLTHLDLREFLPPSEWNYSANHVAAAAAQRSGQRTGWWDHHKDALPYGRSDSVIATWRKVPWILELDGDYVFPKRLASVERQRVPARVPLDAEFGFFLGMYLADGCTSDHQVSIAKKEPTVQARLLEQAHKWGIGTRVVDADHTHVTGAGVVVAGRSGDVRLHCTTVAKLLPLLVGRGAREKFVPPWVLQAPREFLVAFVSGYFTGDGTVTRQGELSASTASPRLREGVAAALSTLGMHAKLLQPVTLKDSNVAADASTLSRVYTMHVRNGDVKVAQRTLQLVGPKADALAAVGDKAYRFSRHSRIPGVSAPGLPDELRYEDAEAMLRCHDEGTRRLPPRAVDALRAALSEHVLWDEVVEITPVEPPAEHPYVYDLTVEGTRTFTLANGLAVNDTFHHTGLENANITVGGMPRLQQLTSRADASKSANMTLAVPITQATPDAVARSVAERVARTLAHLSLRSLVASSTVDAVPPTDVEQLTVDTLTAAIRAPVPRAHASAPLSLPSSIAARPRFSVARAAVVRALTSAVAHTQASRKRPRDGDGGDDGGEGDDAAAEATAPKVPVGALLSGAPPRLSRWAIRLQLAKDTAARHAVTLDEVVDALRAIVRGDALVTSVGVPWGATWTVQIRLASLAVGDPDQQPHLDGDDDDDDDDDDDGGVAREPAPDVDRAAAAGVLDALLHHAAVRGMPPIALAVVAREDRVARDPRSGALTARPCYVVRTNGSRFADARLLAASVDDAAVDLALSTTSNIPEVERSLGVEAAVLAIAAEQRKVLMSEGKYVDPRHAVLQADTMAARAGVVLPFNSENMDKLGASTWLRAFFAKALVTLSQAALQAEADPLGGATERQIVGVSMLAGSGIVRALPAEDVAVDGGVGGGVAPPPEPLLFVPPLSGALALAAADDAAERRGRGAHADQDEEVIHVPSLSEASSAAGSAPQGGATAAAADGDTEMLVVAPLGWNPSVVARTAHAHAKARWVEWGSNVLLGALRDEWARGSGGEVAVWAALPLPTSDAMGAAEAALRAGTEWAAPLPPQPLREHIVAFEDPLPVDGGGHAAAASTTGNSSSSSSGGGGRRWLLRTQSSAAPSATLRSTMWRHCSDRALTPLPLGAHGAAPTAVVQLYRRLPLALAPQATHTQSASVRYVLETPLRGGPELSPCSGLTVSVALCNAFVASNIVDAERAATRHAAPQRFLELHAVMEMPRHLVLPTAQDDALRKMADCVARFYGALHEVAA